MNTIHKILGGIAAIILIVVMALNVNFSAKSNDFSDTFLANLEALAGGESNAPCPGGCASWRSSSDQYEGGVACDCYRYPGECYAWCN